MSEYTPHIGVREITTNDGDFLIDMVLEAVNWDRENVTRRGVLSAFRLLPCGEPEDAGRPLANRASPRP